MLNATLNHDKGDTMHRTFYGTVALILAALALSFSTAAAEVVVSPDSLDFGEIPTGATVTRTFWVKNTGTDSLIDGFSSSRNSMIRYSFSPDSLRLAPGDSVEVSLGITGLITGSQHGTRVFSGGEGYSDGVFSGPIITYSVVSSGLDTQSAPIIRRCQHEQRFKVSGSRVTALQNSQLTVEPDSGLVLRKEYADGDSLIVWMLAPLTMPTGVYKLLFLDGTATLDSLYVLVTMEMPIVGSVADTLTFSSQKQQDTLLVRGWNLFSYMTFEFPSSGLSVVSSEIFPDTMALLTVEAAPGTASGFVEFDIYNPVDSLRSVFIRAIYVNADALPLAPESGAPGAALPRAFSLGANCPNPFNPSTTISYSLGGEAPLPVRLNVFNVRGQIVATLVDRVVAPGQYTVNWDGRGRGGEQLSSGVYFYRLRAGDFSFTRKMVLLK